MAITNYKYLQFFDKAGDGINFEYDSTKDLWNGTFYIPRVSVGLVESCQFFIMESLQTGPTAEPSYGFPHIAGSTGATSAVLAYWEDIDTSDFFLYQYDNTTESPTLEIIDTLSIDFNIDPLEIGNTGSTYSGMKITSIINTEALQLSVAFLPKTEDVFERVLLLKDVERDVVFARLTFYGVSEGEDERLSVLLNNLGDNISNEDFKIFDFTDINEGLPDYTQLNYKRKELCLEFHNIFNTVGSYKSLINAIKFFGYDQVTVKEYWKNVDVNSKNFGKYRHVNITDIFTDNPNFNTSKSLIPSKFFKKTSTFGLFYDITRETGEYTEDGLPVVEETFLFSIEEVLIKLFALKNKLKEDFLPISASIIDIVGELLVFSKYDINIWNDQNRVDKIDLNIRPKVSAQPGQYGYIEDLRALQSAGCPIAPDLTVGGTHLLRIFDFVVDDADEGDVFTIVDTITMNSITYTTGEDENDAETIIGLINAWNSSPNYPFINFQVYAFGPTANGRIRVVEQVTTDYDFDLQVVQGIISGTPTLTSTELFLGATAMTNYANCFLGYFQAWQTPIDSLNDAPEIPVGYPVVLSNDSFNVTWDEAQTIWNSLDEINADPLSQGYGLSLYGPWVTSFEIIGATPGSELITIGVTGFPALKFAPMSKSDGYWDWITIERDQFYEMQWIITCTESPTVGASGWKYDSTILPIDALIQHAVVLPYVGKYRLELFMWDLYNGKSYLKTDNFFEVDLKDSDTIGWYVEKELDYTWDDSEIKTERTQTYLPNELEPRSPQLITDERKLVDSNTHLGFDDYNSTWDLPLQPNEEMNMGEVTYELLDKIEFYQRIPEGTNPPNLVDLKSYTWENAGRLNLDKDSEYVRWRDLDRTWWNATGPKLTRFEINGIGSTSTEMSISNPVTNRKSIMAFVSTGTTSDKFKEIVHILNTYGASATNINLATGSTSKNVENLFDKFIFYYNERYALPFGSTHGHVLTPYISAVSREADAEFRYEIGYSGMSGDAYNYYTANFGTIGDTPIGFEIYDYVSGPTGTIKIGKNAPYVIGSTSLNLIDLANELNGATAAGIKDYLYNVVIGQTGGTHGIGITGSLTGVTGATSLGYGSKIIAVKKSYNAYDYETYEYGTGVRGTTYGRSVTSNISWDELRIIKYQTNLGRWTQGNFSYVNGGMHGKKNPTWELIRENDSEWVNIYYNGEYFSYLFNKSGSYTINLTLEDTNGNIKTITKKEIIKIK